MDSRILDIVSSCRTMRPCEYIHVPHVWYTRVVLCSEKPKKLTNISQGETLADVSFRSSHSACRKNPGYLFWKKPMGLQMVIIIYPGGSPVGLNFFSRFLHTCWAAELHANSGCPLNPLRLGPKVRVVSSMPTFAFWSTTHLGIEILEQKTEKLSKHLEGLLLYMKERLSRIWLHWWMTPLDQYISCLGARLPSSSSCSSALTDT